MGFPRFYTDQAIEEKVIIAGSRAHYMRNVLRLTIGDHLCLFNGKGGEYKAQITTLSKHELTLDILEYFGQNRQSDLKIALGLAVIKRDAMDAAIQKATELGVHKIQPLLCINNTVSPKGMDKRLRHWQEISISACEQCGLNIIPEINPPLDAQTWFEGEADLKLIASPTAKQSLNKLAENPGSIFIAIGPEGGFAVEEVCGAIDKGFKEINLGARILRADTAVTTMMSLSQYCWGDL